MPTTFSMHAVNLFDSISIKNIRTVIDGRVISSTPQELHVQYGEDKYLFVFRFGCLVFFGFTPEAIDVEIQKIRVALGTGVVHPTSENYQVVVGDGGSKVEFEFVELKKLSPDHLRLVALTLGQSAGLEYFEVSTEKMLTETAKFLERMSDQGNVPLESKNLIKIIGSTASTRQHIISNLSILDPPDVTWKSKDLENLHRDLQSNFDIDLRFKTLDRKLTLIQDNIEILTDLVSTRRSVILEGLIVFLIVFEILLVLFTRH